MKKYLPDHYAQKARRENFVARSIYKLQEIDKKFHIFSPISKLSKHNESGDIKILDLGAAPGSWTQHMLQTLSKCVRVVSVDLNPLHDKVLQKYDDRLISLQKDFTNPNTQKMLFDMGPYQCIVSDAAPETTGNKTVDTTASEFLVKTAFFIAQKALIPNGTLVTKLFQSGQTHILIQHMKRHFSFVQRYRPNSVSKHSFEHYVICR